MTTTYVALLRGINVGRAKRVAMADLRRLMEDLGCGDVRTLLNSGNVVFTASGSPKGIAERIEKAMITEIGVSSRVLVLTADELDAAVQANRLSKVGTNSSRMFVGFLWEPIAELKSLVSRKWGRESLAAGPRVAYLWCPDGMLESPLGEAFGRALGDGVTVRNWATVTKLHALTKTERPTTAKSPKKRPSSKKAARVRR